jgi:hypothetical protein
MAALDCRVSGLLPKSGHSAIAKLKTNAASYRCKRIRWTRGGVGIAPGCKVFLLGKARLGCLSRTVRAVPDSASDRAGWPQRKTQ